MGIQDQVYNELREQLADTLETQYNYCMFNKDFKGAYETLGKLMEYKLIDKQDQRLSSKYFSKIFKKAGIDKKHRFPLDLRTDSNYIPTWIFGQLPLYFETALTTKVKAGKRIEGEYEGDMIIPERRLNVRIDLIRSPKLARTAIIDLAETYKQEVGRDVNIKEIADQAYTGVIRVYNIWINSEILSKYKNLGYVVVGVSESGVYDIKIILKSKVLNYYLVDIATACKTIKSTVEANLSINDKPYMVNYIVNYTNAIEKQKKIFEENELKIKEILNAER